MPSISTHFPASLPSSPELEIGRQYSLFNAVQQNIRPSINPSITIRNAKKEDVFHLNELVNSVIEEGDSLQWIKPKSVEWHKWYLDCCIDNGYPVLLAFDEQQEGQLVAYGAIEHGIIDPAGDTGYFSARLSLVVSRLYRRQHIAARLWYDLQNHPLTLAKRIYQVNVRVLTANAAAVHTLKRWQFRFSGVLSNVAELKGKRTHEAFFSTSISPQPTAEERAHLGYPSSVSSSPLTTHGKPPQDFDPAQVVYRDAVIEDALAICAVYNESIVHGNSLADWHEEKTLEDRTAWLQRTLDEGYPVLVAEYSPGLFAGYMSLDPYGEEDECYLHTAVISAFMQPSARRHRIGEHLYRRLLKHPTIPRKQIEHLIADVFIQNAMGLNASIKAGFKHVCTLSQLNVKWGEFVDLAFLQKDLSPKGSNGIEGKGLA